MIKVKRVIQQQKLDYDKIIKGKDLDYARYEDKFKYWDDQIKSGNPDYSQLTDLTLYSFAFFYDLENDEPLKLTAYQDAIAQCKHSFRHDDPNRYILYKSSNQIGKSLWLCVKSIQIALTEKNRNIVIISKSLPQSQFLLKQIKQLLNNSKFANTWKQEVGETDNTTVMTFERNEGKILNRIICAPAGEGTLGYPIHYLFLDEFDFYEEGQRFFWSVAFARTKKTKGQIICFSNPNPNIARSGSILWELWNGDLFQRKFTFKFLDAPWNTIEEYERDKRNSPSHIFASTHDGEFPIEGGSFFSHMEIQDMLQREWNNDLPSVDRPVYIALDIGKMMDQTVLGIGIAKKSLDPNDKYLDLDVKYTLEFPLRTDYDVIAIKLKEIKEYYEEHYHGVAGIGYDSTGQKTFGDMLKRMGVPHVGVDFSKKESNKTILFNDFKLMVENRKIKVVYTHKAEKQLSELMFKVNPDTKRLKLGARSESIHDDYCDMLSVLIHIAVTPSNVPSTATYIKRKFTHTSTAIHTENPGKDYDKNVKEYIARTVKQNQYEQEPWFSDGGFRNDSL